mgnify:CR=1 FL=1
MVFLLNERSFDKKMSKPRIEPTTFDSVKTQLTRWANRFFCLEKVANLFKIVNRILDYKRDKLMLDLSV